MDKKRILIIVIVAVLALSLIPIIPKAYSTTEQTQRTETYTESEPYTTSTPQSVQLIDWSGAVSAGHYNYFSKTIDITSKSNNQVSGTILETAGYDINFYVLDQQGFNSWKSGNTASKYVDASKIKSYTFNFIPNKSDTYYFVLDNGYSIFTNKVPSITANWNYISTTTAYRDVQKQRTITENVPVQKTAYVNLIQLLTQATP
jgi:hypothetical protein